MSSFYDVQSLAPGGLANLGPACGQRLRILQGAAWITQGDDRDLVVEAGERLYLDGPGTALVTALAGPVLFAVEPVRATALAA
jgi:hypothetical protein